MIFEIGIAVFSLQMGAALLLQLGKLISKKPLRKTAKKTKITILIPFHNESKRILPLINSLNEVKPGKNIELIFIDDHSTDDTVNMLMKKLKVPHQCVNNNLPKGKKFAIKYGVSIAPHPNIITWDADIAITTAYFETISYLDFTDLMVMPVQMRSSKLVGKLASVEFSFLQTLCFGMAGFGLPVLCYGANLGFKKETFLEIDKERLDYNQASGDDLFLLKAMLEAKRKVTVYSHSALEVTTKAPSKFKKIIQQRQRWFSKMGPLFNASSLSALILLVSVQLMALISWIMCFFNPLFFVLLGIKFLAEIIASGKFVRQGISHLFVLALHQFWYPFYLIALCFPLPTESKWTNPKGETAVYHISDGKKR